VVHDTLYAITHGEWRPAVVAQRDAIVSAMPEKVTRAS
jgi:hypothetical protein